MNSAEKKRLKAQAHSLKPVIMIGNAGLTPAVLNEIEIALDYHELIKIRVRAEKEVREQITLQLCQDTRSELIQKIGQISVVYRHNPNKN